ncbi:MAG: DUF3159 domain-containing protein [Micrococcales bacterium]|nr:DUF3159 domain-containing protein [Micrococcales bacterium]
MTDERDPRPPAERIARDEPDTFSTAFAQAARRSALGHLTPGEAPSGRALLGAMGGVRGLVESIVPGVVFLVVFTFTRNVPLSVGAPGVVSLLFIAARLVQRQPVTLAVAGLFGVLLSAILAIVTGRAANNFLFGFGIDTVLSLVMLVSLAVRRPLIGVLVGLLTGDGDGWRAGPAKRRVAVIATVLWAAFPLARLAVQVPLYLADLPAALGVAKLIMGVPLYAGVVWVTWLLVRSVLAPSATTSDGPDDGAPRTV